MKVTLVVGLGTVGAGLGKIWVHVGLQTRKSESWGNIYLHLEYLVPNSIQDQGLQPIFWKPREDHWIAFKIQQEGKWSKLFMPNK